MLLLVSLACVNSCAHLWVFPLQSFFLGLEFHTGDLDLLSSRKALGIVIIWAVLCRTRSWALMVLVGLSRSGYLFCSSMTGAELVLAGAPD